MHRLDWICRQGWFALRLLLCQYSVRPGNIPGARSATQTYCRSVCGVKRTNSPISKLAQNAPAA